MHVTVISLNGLQELSGGGLYLRSLVSGLLQTEGVAQVQVISKKIHGAGRVFGHERVTEVELEKNTTVDILARARLQPTFLGHHARRIVRACAASDLVVLHNSRGGLILAQLRKAWPGRKFIVCSDNVEYDLQRQKAGAQSLPRSLVARLEAFQIRRAEACCLAADHMTFITAQDRALFAQLYGGPAHAEILPITVPDPYADGRGAPPPGKGMPWAVNGAPSEGSREPPHDKAVLQQGSAVSQAGGGPVLFTGHFGFAPNQHALQVLLQVASTLNQGRVERDMIRFVVAGAGLDRLPPPGAPGVVYHAAPDIGQMDALFRSAALYVAPVVWGSGMKTKVAEALSYGLPVVALPHACVGYEPVLAHPAARSVLAVAQDAPGLANLLATRLDTLCAQDRQRARQVFLDHYSMAAQSARFLHIFRTILLLGQNG
ncbi:glycosyltransferase [Castellaniella sp.]|uniref:glycosyltransferase n=1 Tax=Castellaniella sp. TaxID=1955812 RepID=UPI0035616436